MATQLRLVDPPPAAARSSRRRSGAAGTGTLARTARVGARAPLGSGRRAAHWGDWQLDARTRTIGRAGVAAARAALQQANEPESLPRAS
ncbi:MAG: hypothetical protein ACHQIG_02555 [Acidimicrobiia bacterium]